MKQCITTILVGLLPLLFVACPSKAPRDSSKAPGDSSEDGRRITEELGGFSYVPPKGWEPRTIPGVRFKGVFGPVSAAGYSPIILIGEVPYNGTFDAYVKSFLVDLHKQYKEVKLLQQDDFKTTAGLQCVHLVIELNGTDGRKMRQTYYLFGKGDTEYVFVCTAQADVGDKLDAEIESTMKSFRFKEK